VSYQPQSYPFSSAYHSSGSDNYVNHALKPSAFNYKQPISPSAMVLIVESDGSGVPPVTGYGGVLPAGDFEIGTVIQTPLGTYANWFYMFRHGTNRGMNLLYLDGHVGYSADYATNVKDFDCTQWGFYNYP
jgi:prepilin-type processing-associated H-X9-DG protein